MINLINIGYDIGDLTVNAFNAILESDIIINYDNIDLSSMETFLKGKEIFDKDCIKSEEDEENLSEDVTSLDEESAEISEENKDNDSIFSKLNDSYALIEFAIKKSLDRNVVIIASNNQSIDGISNLLIQISSKYSDVQLKIYPGVSPIDYASSLLGAPFNDFLALNLNNPLESESELKNKINYALKNNLIIFVHNIKQNEDECNFNILKNAIDKFNDELLIGIVNNSSYELCQFKDIGEANLNSNSTLIIGNKLSYELEGFMVNSCDYIVEPKFIEQNMDFFERYLKDETPKGLDYDCEYIPCHKSLEACDFCYCPFYPCADAITGGEWIKDRDIWSCQHCDWVHLENPCQVIREGLEGILKDKNDLKDKHIELLKLRRECLLKTLK